MFYLGTWFCELEVQLQTASGLVGDLGVHEVVAVYCDRQSVVYLTKNQTLRLP